jgi:histidine ammonia-lyase
MVTLVSDQPVVLGRSLLNAPTVHRIAVGRSRVGIDAAALARVSRNREVLETAIDRGEPIYGVTTGLGALQRRNVPHDEVLDAQRWILRSHAAGVGESLPREIVRAALTVRLQGLLHGYSGIRTLVLERIAELLNLDLIPIVPRTGSLGASGDLAPSAHAFLPLIGEGFLVAQDGSSGPAAEKLGEHGLAPLELVAKEALALINGTHFMAAVGALATVATARLADAADVIAALTLEALYAHPEAFDERVHELRRLEGQARTAATIRALTAGSTRLGAADDTVQDAYSLRCVPQTHGAARAALTFFAELVEVDLNAVTDNPIVFSDPPAVISAGNFHGQSLALAFDTLRLALADLGAVSDRRTFRLLAPSLNRGLPPFLGSPAGPAHGYMIAQYTGAALVAELRVLAHPVSVDNVTTSDNQEDHVSMGMTSALLTIEACAALTNLLAIEAICAAQAIDLSHGELGRGTCEVFKLIRENVPKLDEDRPPAYDIAAIASLIESGRLTVLLDSL